MAATMNTARRPEALADVPGASKMEFTGAVVRLEGAASMEPGRDSSLGLGLGVVLDGQRPSRASVLDLGDGRVRDVDLTREVVVLDWIYDTTLAHLGTLLEGGADGGRRYASQVATEVLKRLGYSSLTRPVFLRMGFRDICQDLDPHEAAGVRIRHPAGEVIRVELDCDGCCLRVEVPEPQHVNDVSEALAAALPLRESQRVQGGAVDGATLLRIRFPLPLNLQEALGLMDELRDGMQRLVQRLEPERARAIQVSVSAFGARESLARFLPPGEATSQGLGEGRDGRRWVPATPPSSKRVH
ncbi:MAG: hypothetical protein WEA09_00955 [Gemmatimonadota bacterium]